MVRQVETASGGSQTPHKKDKLEAIAVVGFSIGFPQDATSSDAFWDILMQKRNTASGFPAARMNIDAMYHPDTNRRGQIPVSRSHFLKQDIACFDAPFFGTSTTDAASMDPQQRMLLEYTYKALENAGMPMETVAGSKTSVYTGSFATDWQHMAFKDGEQCETTTALGTQASFNANRISWFFDFRGNSANVDTACSSSLVALDMGCQGLRSGDAEMSVVAGSNLILSPDNMHSLTNLNMLSPSGQCYSFDHRANGYSRGEGFGILVLKRVSDAIRDHNTIRGIIRSTGCNQDGNTPSITLPSAAAQESLIREAYDKAGLSLEHTRFFEAHGTGTPVGDPNEAKAFGSAFRHVRTSEDPLWIGAVKSNIGHLEGASGIAGVIKAMLILEKGIIPPNTNFEKVNPKIDTEFLRIKFPLEPIPWPAQGLRRASVNSFGNAGTNAHVILDDVFHFLNDRGLQGQHVTVREPPTPAVPSRLQQQQISTESTLRKNDEQREPGAKLLVFSSFDAAGIKRQVSSLSAYFSNIETSAQRETYLNDLAFTLCSKRSSLPYKASAVVKSLECLRTLEQSISTTTKSIANPQLCFIFTGQGAQWAGMGRELMSYPVFRESFLRSEDALLSFGSDWSLREKLLKEENSTINRPEFSQPICTAIQIALVDLLRSFDIAPVAVIGHSSGEIAAAYSAGYISARSALKLAYFRGLLATSLATSQEVKGGMMSIGLSEEQTMPYIGGERRGLTVACVNSPKNVTISGDEDQIYLLKEILDAEKVPTHKLVVDVAYHSPHMTAISKDYLHAIDSLESGVAPSKPATMISSVTGKIVTKKTVLSPQYWNTNLVSPVRFADAVQDLLSRSLRRVRRKLDLSHRNYFQVNMLVEVGPHSALRGSIKDILDASGATNIGYTSILKRKDSAISSMLDAVGKIVCLGYRANLEQVNHSNTNTASHPMTLPDLPSYVFDHSKQYWSESRISARYRLHHQGKLDLLGKPVLDWNPFEARWRNILRSSEMPWMEDHVINGSVIYPGAGMVVMAIEAANQLSDTSCDIDGFELKDISFKNSLNIPQSSGGIETQLSIRVSQTSAMHLATWSEFSLYSYEQGTWRECCHGFIRVKYASSMNDVSRAQEISDDLKTYHKTVDAMNESCKKTFKPEDFYGTLKKSGLALGPPFQRIQEGRYGDQKQAQGTIKLYDWPQKEYPQPHIIHPISLDAVFHFAIAGYFGGGTKGVSTMVPTFLRRLYVQKNGLSSPGSDNLHECAWTTREDDRNVEFSGFALNESRDQALLDFEDLRTTKIGEFVETDLVDVPGQQNAHNICHRPDPDLSDTDEILSYCQERPSSGQSPFNRYVDIIAHKRSSPKILEVGGAINQDLTSELLKGFSVYNEEQEPIYIRYDSYHFASDQADALDEAEKILAEYPRTTFRHFDIQDPTKQGIEAASFDIVIAPLTFRKTSLFLDRMSSILKSNGILMFHEPRFLEPNQPNGLINGYHTGLEKNGFVEPALELVAAEGTSQVQNVHIYERLSEPAPGLQTKSVAIVYDSVSSIQTDFAKVLANILNSREVANITFMDLIEFTTIQNPDEMVFICLLELDRPFLNHISETDYNSLKLFLIGAKSILWVNSCEGSCLGKPDFALVQGLVRVLRNEYEDHIITTVSLQHRETFSERQLRSVVDILMNNHILDAVSGTRTKDFEYIEIDGLLNVPRIFPDKNLSQELINRSSPQKTSITPFREAPPLRLTLGSPGLLDTLHFIEDREHDQPLADNEIKVEVHAIGVNFKDCLIALGQISNAKMGQECAGIVTAVGSSSEFALGDRVVLATSETYKTFAIGKHYKAYKIPSDMSFTTAAAIPAQFGAAWGAIHGAARLQKHESILIHAAAGGTGQAAIQIAKLIGATIFATVGSEYKKQILINEYNIPEENIFYSRDTSFVKGIKRRTAGRGVDVVLNSLVGDGLIASWECIAPCGRFIELGKKDITANSTLPMSLFEKNVSFIGFDGALWGEHNHKLGLLVDMFANGTLHLPKPFVVHNISEIEQVFRTVQEGNFAGKMVLEINAESRVTALLDNKATTHLNPNATYVIAGGFGGIGRATARWMVSRSARNLVLLSRFGPRTPAAHELLDELRKQGVRVEAPACDITDTSLMQTVFEKLSSTMPPFKGCVQASIIAKDGLFKDMGYESWKPAVDCKVTGSWNLHSTLPRGMDFFILLASASGLAGLRGQANYNAGNTYEDALARHRVSHGEKAISLDLGAMTDDGILAENPHLLDRVLGYGTLEPISRKKYFDILDYYCNPTLPLLTPTESQAAIGLGVGGGSGLESFDFSRQAMLYPLVLDGERQEASTTEKNKADSRHLLAASTSLDEASEIVMQAVIDKLANSISAMQDKASIDTRKPLQMYGVDSLLAIELRNWVVKEFIAEVAVFETQGASTLETLSRLVAGRSSIKHEKWVMWGNDVVD